MEALREQRVQDCLSYLCRFFIIEQSLRPRMPVNGHVRAAYNYTKGNIINIGQILNRYLNSNEKSETMASRFNRTSPLLSAWGI